MPAPWVIFDSAAAQEGDCTEGADPDIAGIGVVISFVIASAMTTSASILAMLLDHVFDANSHSRFREPIKYLHNRFSNTGWKRNYAWRPFLDPLIIEMGDQQLVTGYAVLLSGWVKVWQNSFEVQGAHFVLILYICALSSSSHLAALITLRKYFRQYRLIAKIRITVVVVFALFLLASMVAAIAKPGPGFTDETGVTQRVRRLSFLVPMAFILVGFSTALATILYRPQDAELSLSLPASVTLEVVLKFVRHVFTNPLISFIVQIILAILSVILVLSQKFSEPEEPEKWCGLMGEEENTWGFGQTLSMVMLVLPMMSAGQAYLEGRQHIREG